MDASNRAFLAYVEMLQLKSQLKRAWFDQGRPKGTKRASIDTVKDEANWIHDQILQIGSWSKKNDIPRCTVRNCEFVTGWDVHHIVHKQCWYDEVRTLARHRNGFLTIKLVLTAHHDFSGLIKMNPWIIVAHIKLVVRDPLDIRSVLNIS